MKLALVYGTAAPAGRLATALSHFKAAVEAEDGASAPPLDLSKTSFDWADGRPQDQLSAPTQEAIREVSSCSALVIFAPVYRATAPGALKNFLDLLPVSALEAKPVGIVAMGATPHHFLGVESDLHPILSWFGAVSIPPGVYLTSSSFESGRPTTAASEELTFYARTMIAFTRRLDGIRLAPRPLAARSRG